MKKVLIITYYWPPAGGPGVQRVLKFVKYFPQLGWEPHVLTVKHGEYIAYDQTLEQEIPEKCFVYKTDLFEPNVIYKKFIGKPLNQPIPIAAVTKKSKNWKEKLAKWIRLNLFIPDAKIGWKPYAIRKGIKIINTVKPDIILSSSPPPTVHLIALRLANAYNIPWIADFRDPWTKLYHYDLVKKLKIANFFEKRMEKKVVLSCTIPVTVSKNFASLLGGQKYDKQFQIIPNGYDADDISFPEAKQQSTQYSITHVGKLNSQQNPVFLWKSLKQLTNENLSFSGHLRLDFVGIPDSVIKDSIEEYGLSSYTTFSGYLPHGQAIERMFNSQLLLLIIPNTRHNEGILPGKLFEYLIAQKMILAVGPKFGQVDQILSETDGGKIFRFDELPLHWIEDHYNNWRAGKQPSIKLDKIKKYTRENLTLDMVKLMENIL